MNRNILIAAAIAGCFSTGLVQAQEYSSKLDASLRLGLGLNTEPDAQLTFENYGSRLRWNGSAETADGKSFISYLEFGFDQDAGVSNTRQAWIGYEADAGTFKGGKQYNAFYDAVTAAVDIANWGSCVYEFGCSRQSSVLKFTSLATGDLQYMLSTTLENDDLGNDFIDQLDLGARLTSGDRIIGAGVSLLIGNQGATTDSTVGELETGIALAATVTQPLAEGTASLSVQYGNEDYLSSQNELRTDDDGVPLRSDNGLSVTGAFSMDQVYAILSLRKEDSTPFYLTLGYNEPIIDNKARAYFELSAVELDIPGEDLDLQARAVMVFDMDLLSSSGEL